MTPELMLDQVGISEEWDHVDFLSIFSQLEEINISTVEWRGYHLISETNKERKS